MPPLRWKAPKAKNARLSEDEQLKKEARRFIPGFENLALKDRVRRMAEDPTPPYLYDHAAKLLNRQNTARRRNNSADFEVDSIVGEDFCSGNLCGVQHARRREFRVRFVGYGASDDEWLPRSKLDCDEEIEAYQAQHAPPASPAESTDVSSEEDDDDAQPEEQATPQEVLQKMIERALGDDYQDVMGEVASGSQSAKRGALNEQMSVDAPTSPARARDVQRSDEPVAVSSPPPFSSPPRPPSPGPPPSPPPRAARERTPDPPQDDWAARGAAHGRLEFCNCDDCVHQRHLLRLQEQSSLSRDHHERRQQLLTDLEHRWEHYHGTSGADRARYRNLRGAEAKDAFHGVFAFFDVSQRSLTYQQHNSVKQAIRRGLYPY